MPRVSFRTLTAVVLVLAGGLRVAWLCSHQVIPVTWDARRYAAAGIGLISYVDQSYPPLPFESAPDRERFRQYAQKYIQGEQIQFTPYAEHRLTEAREDILFSPVHATLMAAVFVLSPTADLMVARGVTVLLDLLAILFLVLVARRLFDTTVAMLSGLLYAVYTPFIASSTMLLLETPTNALLLGTLYLLLRAGESQKLRHLLGSGMLLGLLVLTKPSASLLVVPLLFGFSLQFRSTLTAASLRRSVAWILAPVLVITATLLTVASLTYGELTFRNPDYQEAGIRQSSSVAFEGYDLDIVTADFWERSPYRELVTDPLGAAGLFIKKLVRLWYQPYNDFGRSLFWPTGVDRGLHLMLLLLGPPVLLLLWYLTRIVSGWLIGLVAYYTALHIVLHSVSRYNFNAIPAVMIGVAWLLVMIWRRIRENSHHRTGLVLGLGVLVLSAVLFPAISNSGPGGIQSQFVILGRLLLGMVGLAVGYWLVVSRLLDGPLPIARTVPILATAAVVSAGFAVSALSRDRWAEYETEIPSPEMVAGTRIYLKELPATREGELLAIALDVRALPDLPATYRLAVGSAVMDLDVGANPNIEEYYFKKNYKPFAELCRMEMRELRHYALVTVTPEVLARVFEQDGCLDISVRLRPDSAGRTGAINLYGSILASEAAAWLPSFRAETIERFVEYGDPRIRQKYEFMSDSAKSYYIPASGAAESTDTDSRAQSPPGRYHMFLVHGTSDRGLLVY